MAPHVEAAIPSAMTRDVHETFRPETEIETFSPETKTETLTFSTEMRPPVDRDETFDEGLETCTPKLTWACSILVRVLLTIACYYCCVIVFIMILTYHE